MLAFLQWISAVTETESLVTRCMADGRPAYGQAKFGPPTMPHEAVNAARVNNGMIGFVGVGILALMFLAVSTSLASAQVPPGQSRTNPTSRYGGGQSYNEQLIQRGDRNNAGMTGWENWNEETDGRFPINPTENRPFVPNVTEGVEIGPIDPNNSTPPNNRPLGEFMEASRIVARVGEHAIFAGDILPEVNELIETRLAGMPDSIKETQRAMLMEQMIPKAVEQKLMFVDAIQQLPDPEKLPDIMDSVRDQFVETQLPLLIEQYKVSSATELDARLRVYGGSLRRLRQQWSENQFIGFMVRQQIDIDPEVTHQELLDYYREHIEDYAIPAKARWQELMVRFDKAGGKNAAYREIASMGDEVVFGAPFEAVAERRSNGFTADKGGMQDWTTQGALRDKALDQALFELPINYLSDIIETDQGLHIIRILERQEADFVSFRVAQVEIRDELKQKKQSAALEDYMAKIEARIPVWTIVAEKEGTEVAR